MELWIADELIDDLKAECKCLRKVLAEKDKEIERLKETTIDVWIKVPKEDSDGYTN